MKVYVKKVGHGEPIVFLHGWGFSGAIWSSLCENLSSDYELWCIDLPGFGHSELMPYEQSSMIAAMVNVLPASFTVVGWSLGGLLATEMALQYPKRVKRVINIASSPYFVHQKKWPGIKQEVLKGFNHRLEMNYLSTMMEFIYLHLPFKKRDGRLLSKLRGLIEQQKPQPKALAFGLNALMTWDLRAKLQQLICPLHYIFGELDALVPKDTAQNLLNYNPNANCVVIKGAGHIPFISHDEQFLESFRAFLSS